jgi:hypothetical protein
MCGSYHNTAFPSRWKLKCTPTYTPHRYGLRRRSPSAPLTTSIGLTSRVVSPAWPSLYRGPLRPFEALPRWGPPCCGLGRRDPALIAPLGSCARPPPSRVLRPMAWYASLCRSPRAPAGRRPCPMLSPPSLWRGLDPYPAALLRCPYPFLPEAHRPHLTCKRFGALRLPP